MEGRFWRFWSGWETMGPARWRREREGWADSAGGKPGRTGSAHWRQSEETSELRAHDSGRSDEQGRAASVRRASRPERAWGRSGARGQVPAAELCETSRTPKSRAQGRARLDTRRGVVPPVGGGRGRPGAERAGRDEARGPRVDIGGGTPGQVSPQQRRGPSTSNTRSGQRLGAGE